MKWIVSILLMATAVSGRAAPAIRPFTVYQVILDRKPFGEAPPPPKEPERVTPVHESFAAQMILSSIDDLEDGDFRVTVIDKKDNSYFSVVIGETTDTGIELIDVDYDKEEAVLKKSEEVVVLRMSGSAGTQVLTSSERQERMKNAEERRMSYAERRRQRMLERQKPVEIPKPVYTGEELEKHLQDYQMEVIRQGLPPLPVQLSPDRDAQLVAEGYLPELDEDGYIIEYEDEYYEDEAY